MKVKNKFPIKFTEPKPLKDLEGWIEHFKKKNIAIKLKQKGDKYELWRELTDFEKMEMEMKIIKIRKNWIVSTDKKPIKIENLKW